MIYPPSDVNGTVEWRKELTLVFGSGEGFSAQQTLDGGYIRTGYGDSGLFLLKTDALGNEQWSKNYGEGNNARGHSVQQTSDGGYIITGRFSYVIQKYLIRIPDIYEEHNDY